jgi:hypothetical protein
MAKPKLLTIFDDNARDTTFAKLNNPVTVRSISGQYLEVEEEIYLEDKCILTFTAPCDCGEAMTILKINGENFEIRDAAGHTPKDLGACSAIFCRGALVSVVVDLVNKVVFIMNAGASRAVVTFRKWTEE